MQTTPRVFEYTNELTDDFSGTNPAALKPYHGQYCYYRRSWWGKIRHFFWNKILGVPIAWMHAKLHFRWRVVNKKAFRQVKGGYFLYGNHTQNFFDAAMPKIISNRDCYTIVNKENIMLPGIGWLARQLGALPILPDLTNTKNLVKAIDQIIADGKPILIYPEAHIWPYYTKIRPFAAKSLRYPVKYNVPAFCFTNTYQKRGRRGQKCCIVTYVDGPFYPNPDLPRDAQIQDLRDRVYAAMVARAAQSDYERYIYKKRVGEKEAIHDPNN